MLREAQLEIATNAGHDRGPPGAGRSRPADGALRPAEGGARRPGQRGAAAARGAQGAADARGGAQPAGAARRRSRLALAVRPGGARRRAREGDEGAARDSGRDHDPVADGAEGVDGRRRGREGQPEHQLRVSGDDPERAPRRRPGAGRCGDRRGARPRPARDRRRHRRERSRPAGRGPDGDAGARRARRTHRRGQGQLGRLDHAAAVLRPRCGGAVADVLGDARAGRSGRPICGQGSPDASRSAARRRSACCTSRAAPCSSATAAPWSSARRQRRRHRRGLHADAGQGARQDRELGGRRGRGRRHRDRARRSVAARRGVLGTPAATGPAMPAAAPAEAVDDHARRAADADDGRRQPASPTSCARC